MRKRKFESLFAGVEDIEDKNISVLYSKRGDYSVILKIENPVQQYSTDLSLYYNYSSILNNIIQVLGEGYCLQKQDIFSRQKYHYSHDKKGFLSESYFRYFEGRAYMEIQTYLIITKESIHSNFVKFDNKSWLDFHSKIEKINDLLSEKKIQHSTLCKKEIVEYIHRYMSMSFQRGNFSMNNILSNDNYLRMGENVVKSFSIVDIDEINLPSIIKPYSSRVINGYSIATDLLSFLADVPYTDCVIYNQIIQIPNQRKEMRRLIVKNKRHASMPDPSNRIACDDITNVLDVIATESKLLVYTNFNIIVSVKADKLNSVTSFLETKLYSVGIMPSKNAYNQLELFTCSFPGNGFSFKKYDLFFCLNDAALCLFYKEHLKHSEKTPLKVFYTDRQGIPVSMDFTGKEGDIKYTDNSNFVCIGPSGSGKSFHMNSVVRQLLEQNTDVVMVDTGNSYEGICSYYQGTYISYTKEHPISMNPFNITKIEYEEDFKEKKNFLKSLLILIWKGSGVGLTGVEETMLDMILEEYFQAFFSPFSNFTEEEKEDLRKEMLLEAKINGEFDNYKSNIEKEYSNHKEIKPLKKDKIERSKRVISKLEAVMNDSAATEGEKVAANNAIMRLTPEVIEKNYLVRIDAKIEEMEDRKRKLTVTSLSFNTFYEFALQRIPYICKENNISFTIKDFKFILKKFYKGGGLEDTLNKNTDSSLFDERFIVFEVDKIKDDPVLFPIVVLIIMDVFLQKMRIKKGRKALIIEEAWKAISSPTMAEYIKYLYKTVRKFHGIAGVVTQELNDVIDSPIVKEAIINNSDIKILLDQSKFKDRYDEIAAVLGLTEVQKKQIFTINSLENHEGRNYFKEVWIARGQYSDVYGVEEPPECYMAYTTERAEKEALNIYKEYYHDDVEKAITQFVKDMQQAGDNKYLNFANKVNKHNKVMELWGKGL